VLVLAVALMFFNWLVGTNPPAWVSEAKSPPLPESIGDYLEGLLPEDPENSILKRFSAGATPTEEAPAEGGAPATPPIEEAPANN
ncbi:MAG: CvpA family protein, partial [Rhizobiaceae bacterium]|nr:CvpA family protein [Rhizobiaceae bacterium]